MSAKTNTARRNRRVTTLVLLLGALVALVAFQWLGIASGASSPPAPVITSSPPNPSYVQTASFTFTDPQAVQFQCSLDGAAFAICSGSGVTSGSISFFGLAAGNHTFKVQAKAGGSTSAYTKYDWTVSAPPAPAIVTKPSNPSYVTSASFTYTSSVSGATFKCALDNAALAACSAGGVSYTGLAAGDHSFKVVAVSPVGQGPQAKYDWKITNPPDKPKITVFPADPTNQTGATFEFSSANAASYPGLVYECRTDSSPTFTTCSSPKTYASGTFSEGNRTFEVRAVAQMGASDVATDKWTVDTTPPRPPTLKKVPDSPNTKDEATFEIKDTESGVSWVCTLDGSPVADCKDNTKLKPVAPGFHEFCARAQDKAGNVSAATCMTWQQTTFAGLPYSISGTVSTPLYPGADAQPIDLTFSNPNAGGIPDGDVKVTSLTVAVSSVTGPNVGVLGPCDASDFAVTQFTGGSFFVHPGTTALSSYFPSSSVWPTIRLINKPSNQDGCKGASVTLSYGGTP